MAPLWGQYWNTKKSWELKSAEKHSRDKHHVTERVNLAVVLYGNNCFLGELQTPLLPGIHFASKIVRLIAGSNGFSLN